MRDDADMGVIRAENAGQCPTLLSEPSLKQSVSAICLLVSLVSHGFACAPILRIDVKASTEDKHLEHVPGTDLLSDRHLIQGNVVEINEASQLKRGVGRYAHVVLIPQPSNDPNDPCVVLPNDRSYEPQLT